MTKRFWLGVAAVGIVTSTIACSRENPAAPSGLSGSAANGSLSELSMTSDPVITLQPDLTANPALVSVVAGKSVLVINNSSRYVRMRSSTCDEFLILGLQPGVSRYSWPFYPAGKTCDYFAWDTNWSRKIFVGRVVVE